MLLFTTKMYFTVLTVYIHSAFLCMYFLSHIVLQPNITSVTITPSTSNDGSLLFDNNDTVSLTCTAEGGPRIMTRWQFDDGSTVETVANDSSSVTYEISSLSTDHTGVYYCEAIIDGMTDTSMNYTLIPFGAHMDILVYSMHVVFLSHYYKINVNEIDIFDKCTFKSHTEILLFILSICC